MITKIKSYLGFAIRSKAVIFGTDLIITAKKRPKLVLYDRAIAENSLKKLTEFTNEKRIVTLAIDGLPGLLSRTNTLAVGVLNKNLATAIQCELEKEKENEYGKSEYTDEQKS